MTTPRHPPGLPVAFRELVRNPPGWLDHAWSAAAVLWALTANGITLILFLVIGIGIGMFSADRRASSQTSPVIEAGPAEISFRPPQPCEVGTMRAARYGEIADIQACLAIGADGHVEWSSLGLGR